MFIVWEGNILSRRRRTLFTINEIHDLSNLRKVEGDLALKVTLPDNSTRKIITKETPKKQKQKLSQETTTPNPRQTNKPIYMLSSASSRRVESMDSLESLSRHSSQSTITFSISSKRHLVLVE